MRLERARNLSRLLRRDQAHFAALGKPPALAPIPPPARRRAPGPVELIPTAAKRGDVRSARIEGQVEHEHRIDLPPDPFRHFRQLDHVVPVARTMLQHFADFIPQRGEPGGCSAIGKTCGKERRVVIAQIGAEPGKPAHQARPNGKWQHEQCFAVPSSADDDGGRHVVLIPDVALPGGKPIEGLEHRAVGFLLELQPDPFDRSKVVIDRQLHRGRLCARRRYACGILGILGRLVHSPPTEVRRHGCEPLV